MPQQWADYRVFWREFRQTFHTTGAVLPSGRALSHALTRYVRNGDSHALPSGEGRQILEVGPGTGAVTTHIIRSMRATDRLTLVERNDQFVTRLRERIAGDAEFQTVAGRIDLVHSGVEQLSEAQPYDLIISGLPLNNFPAHFVEQLAAKFRRLLAADGTLSFFEYVAVRRIKAVVSRRDERARLTHIGRLLGDVLDSSEIKRDLVLANVPPAWVHHVGVGDWGLETGEGNAEP